MCHPGELHVNGRNRHGWYTGDWLPYWFSSLWMRFLPSALTAGQDLPSSLWPFLTFGVKSNNPEWSLAAAKSFRSCLTLCDPIDNSPPGSPVPGILQARTLEWVAISFSSSWKWKLKVKSLSCVWLIVAPWTAAYQALLPMGFSRQEYCTGLPLPSPVIV